MEVILLYHLFVADWVAVRTNPVSMLVIVPTTN